MSAADHDASRDDGRKSAEDPLSARAGIFRAVRLAGADWADAMRAHKMAPPDAGFAARLRALSEAAEREQMAWEYAHGAGLKWRPIADAEHGQPPYELRPGTGRRGPPDQWARFDTAVGALNQAIAGSDAAAVADAFGEISKTAGALAEALAVEDENSTRTGERLPRTAAARSRGLA